MRFIWIINVKMPTIVHSLKFMSMINATSDSLKKEKFVLLCFHAHLFVDALWSPAGKGLTSLLSFVVSYCDVVTFPFYPGSGVVLDCIYS